VEADGAAPGLLDAAGGVGWLVLALGCVPALVVGALLLFRLSRSRGLALLVLAPGIVLPPWIGLSASVSSRGAAFGQIVRLGPSATSDDLVTPLRRADATLFLGLVATLPGLVLLPIAWRRTGAVGAT